MLTGCFVSLVYHQHGKSHIFIKGLTEPNHGSDPAGMETIARESSEGGFVLNGSKSWISSAPVASVKTRIRCFISNGLVFK